MSDPSTCPQCGRQRERREKGIVREARDILAHVRPEWDTEFGCRASVTSEKFDRLMNWLVGMLLVGFISALVVVQASPPR